MPSSLAAQLAKGASLNTALLVDRSRRKPTESYLFTGREADQHDLESLHALASNAFSQLKQWNPLLQTFEDALFSDAVKEVDRTLLSGQATTELNSKLHAFIPLLGKDLMEVPTGRILEWLVRRFRINEFNVEDILALFLPYHDSPHFAKMATILHIKPNSAWSFLNAYKSAAQSVPRSSLVSEMLRDVEVARFVASLLTRALQEQFAHRTMAAFHTGILLEYIARSKTLEDGVIAFLLPALLQPLRVAGEKQLSGALNRELILSSYVLLSALSQKCVLEPSALKIIVSVMSYCADKASPKQFLNAVVSVLSPQTQLDSLPSPLNEAIWNLQTLDVSLLPAVSWLGSEKLVVPLVTELIGRLEEDEPSSMLTSLVVGSDTYRPVLQHIATLLLRNVVANPSSPMTNSRQLLSAIHQRHPDVLQDIGQGLSETEDAVQDTVEQLLLSLSVTRHTPRRGAESADDDMVIASMNVDAEVRAIGIKNMLNALAKGKVDPIEVDSVHSALLARVRDTAPPVVRALYVKPEQFLPVALANTRAYIEAASEALNRWNGTSTRQIVRLHVTFLAKHFARKIDNDAVKDLLERAFFSLLLFSKPKYKTAQSCWEILEVAEKEGPDGLARCELTKGCVEVFRWHESQVRGDGSKGNTGFVSPKIMCRMNLSVASRIAENIITSNDLDSLLLFILSKLSDTNAHARNLAYLVVRSLLSQMSGEHQMDVAQKVLDAMAITTLEGMEGFMKGADSLQEFLGDDNLGNNIVMKPRSKSTLHWLQTSLLAIMPLIVRPPGKYLNFIDDAPTVSTDPSDTRSYRYVRLMRAVYKLANSSTSLPLLSSSLLRAQFISLAEDALAFLAGIWLSRDENSREAQSRFRRAALSHAIAFLAAHETTEHIIDFQTILPALLFALQDPDASVRRLAVECVQLLARLAQATQAKAVYAFDSIYGKNSDQLQYLDWEDYQKYIGSLAELRDHCAYDPGYVRVFHQQSLSGSKKSAAYKQRVLCYVMSHANGCTLPSMKLSLLHMVEDVSDRVKAPMLSSTIQALIDDARSTELQKTIGPRYEEFAALVASTLDMSTAPDLNEPSSNLWSTYLGTLRHFLQPVSVPSTRQTLLHKLEHGLFSRLSFDHQIEVTQIILSVGSQSTDAQAYCSATLAKVLGDADASLLVHLLDLLAPPATDSSQRASKRAKVDQYVTESPASFALLAELLSSITLPGSMELITYLLEVLNRVAHSDTTLSADKAYIEQLLMSALDNAAANVATEATPVVVRLDILVDIIRVSENPQTFHQALLLVSSLARLAPESVLHNIMPVFTFMGSNVFHRDDTYSFRVIQKTINNIVPVMVSSLKAKHSANLDLLSGSRNFLRIFTDAANHVPRHRRTHFFVHLIDVLGPEEFLALVCMLIIGKTATRVVRQQGDDLAATLALPLSLLHHYPLKVQIPVLIAFLHEAQRLMTYVADPTSTQPILLDDTHPDEEQTAQASNLLRRRAQSLVIFVGSALGNSFLLDEEVPGTVVNELVSVLLEIAGASQDDSGVAKAARVAITQCVKVVPALNFVASVDKMLEDENVLIQGQALDLFAERLPTVSDAVRRDATSRVISIVEKIRQFLSGGDRRLVVPGLSAVKAVSLTLSPGEEGALVKCVPLLISASRVRDHREAAIAVLPSLSAKLGPRIIPFFRDIIQECVSILNDPSKSRPKHSDLLLSDALSVLRGLFNSIPSFWASSELASVFRLYLDSRSQSGAAKLIAFVKVVVSKAPTKVLLSTLFDMWSALSTSDSEVRLASHLEGYFDLLKRALRAAPRPSVLEFLRPTFNVLLEGLDLRKSVSGAYIAKVEKMTIAAFLEMVTKLNETAFRPLFRKLFDWSFAVDVGLERKITFCHAYIALLDYFKALMTPYLSFLLQPFIDLLRDSSSTTDNQAEVWLCVLETLTKSFTVDEGAFWREDKLQRIVPPLITQVSNCVEMKLEDDSKSKVQESLTALCEAVNDDALLKRINLDVLMHTRSEDARIRLFALQCSTALWTTHGDKFMGYVPETATFIAECAEDEHDTVVKATHGLKNAVENATGESLDSV
ncbi:ARM repeat-containing protein [Artomyces pyxidatus]|uniref:ARM repeat-containing protein n=1 Tax=Artomyces pyxidatus TaxID=48021 RepID=A0ACB8T518_9AGAM|nr:ARM repeat-containing protein [Artomyces pyxidatus]